MMTKMYNVEVRRIKPTLAQGEAGRIPIGLALIRPSIR